MCVLGRRTAQTVHDLVALEMWRKGQRKSDSIGSSVRDIQRKVEGERARGNRHFSTVWNEL